MAKKKPIVQSSCPVKGSVFWITGLPGSGKSTISRLLFKRLKIKQEKVLLLDGDELRSILGAEGQYSYEERKKLAFIYCRFCKMLAGQGFDVVIATVSLFHDCHKWNREHQSTYYEIYLRVPLDVLKFRNQKNLYIDQKDPLKGLNLPFEEPLEPNVMVDNYGKISPAQAECLIWEQINATR